MATIVNLDINVRARTKAFSKGMKAVRGKLQSFGKSIRRASKGMLVMGVAAAGAAVGLFKMMKAGMAFEKQMSAVKSILTGITNEQFAQLSEAAEKLGRTTAFSATQAAEGMEHLARAGFSGSEIIKAMPGMLDLAAASAMELGDAANVAAQVLRGMGLEADQAGRVADVLAQVSSKANTDVAMLGEAFSYAAPLAKGFGVSMEETAAAIGVLSDAGIQGSRAGTGLKAVFAKLGQEIEGKGLLQAIRDLQEESLSGTEALLRFGKLGAPAVLALTQAGDKLPQLFQDAMDADGIVKQMADTRLDNLSGDLTLLGSAFEGLRIALYEDFGEALRPMVQGLTKFLSAVSQAVKTMTAGFKESGEGATDSSETIMSAFEGVASFIGIISDGIYGMGKLIKMWAGWWLGNVAKVVNALGFVGKALGKIGIDIDTSSLEIWGDALEKTGRELFDEGTDLSGSLPSDKIQSFVDEVKRSMKQVDEVVDETTDKAGENVNKMAAQLTEAQEKFADLAQKLQGQIDTFGMSEDALELLKLQEMGLEQEAMKAVEALQKQLEVLEKNADMMREGERLAEQMRTPIEKYQDEMKRLQELFDAGAISKETFDRAMAKAQEDLPGQESERAKSVTEGLSTALGSIRVAGVQDTGAVQKRQLETQQSQLEQLKAIAKNTGGSSSASAVLT